jgi:hypothetical protein
MYNGNIFFEDLILKSQFQKYYANLKILLNFGKILTVMNLLLFTYQ